MSKPLIQLDLDLKRLGEKIESQANEIKRRTAREALKSVMNYSPVWSGDYVKSHRVGIQKTSAGRGVGLGSHPVTPGKFAIPKMSESKAISLKNELYQKKKGYISTAQPKDSIVISNNIHYADRVEFIGWIKTRPHYPYTLTMQDMSIKFPIIVKTSGLGL